MLPVAVGEYLFHPSAFGDIDVDADHPLGATLAIIRGETARLDPSHPTVWADNAILQTILALPVGEGLVAKAFQPLKVVGKHQSAPLAACNLSVAFGDAINLCITLRNLDPLRFDVVGEGGDKARLSRQRQLRVALSQCEFCLLALSDLDVVAENAARFTGRRVVYGTTHGQEPSNLPVRTDYAKLVPKRLAALRRCFLISSYHLNVVGVNTVAKIRIAFHGSGLDPVDGCEFRCSRDLVRVQIPIPAAYACLQLSEAEPLLACAERVIRTVMLDDVRRLSYIEVE